MISLPGWGRENGRRVANMNSCGANVVPLADFRPSNLLPRSKIDYSRLNLGQEAAVDSVSLLPLLRGESALHGGGAPVRDHLVHHSCLGVFSLRTSEPRRQLEADRRLQRLRRRGAAAPTAGPAPVRCRAAPDSSIHMGDDPWEVYNRYRGNPQVVRELNDELERIRAAEE